MNCLNRKQPESSISPGSLAMNINVLGLFHINTLAFMLLLADGYLPASMQAQGPTSLRPTATSESGQAPLGPKQTWNIGIVLTAQGGPCRGVFACTPIPRDCVDQRVQLVRRDVSNEIRRMKFRDLGDGAKQMVIEVPRIAKDETVHAVLTFEIEKLSVPQPVGTEVLQIPARRSRVIKDYLRPSPFIESQHADIQALARTFERPGQSTWSMVEAMYDWVRENIEYVDSDLKGALAALRDEDGDCEEMTSLFIALCRANNIPARTVWVPGHCYPEFHLVDQSGKGRWYPCQAAGQRAFGELGEPRPILQKGDSFVIPHAPGKKPIRYAQLVGSRPGSGLVHPQIQIIHQQINASDASS